MRTGHLKRIADIFTGSAILASTFFLFVFFSSPSGLIAEMTNDDCLTCHGDEGITAETERGRTLQLYVPENALLGSVHEDLSCTDCHTGADSFEDIPHSKKPLDKGCVLCHEAEMDETSKDVHGKALNNNDESAPSCYICHGGHDIKPLKSPESRFSDQNQPDTCGKCHDGDKLTTRDHSIYKRNLVTRYKSSVHWQALKEGKRAASCTDCHGSHTIMSSSFSESGVSRGNEANSCMKCHRLEGIAFWDGPHGDALRSGNNDVPTCTTCHGDHDMASLRVRGGDAKQWAATQVCIWCHGNSRMMARYGLDTTPVDSYMQDFHGLTQRGTMGASATCADCHDPHHSLPSDHPNSRMHISNRGPACGKCHGKVSESFAMSFSHRKAMVAQGSTLENIIRIIYVVIIIVTIGGMLIYVMIVWLKSVRNKIKKQREEKHLLRMNSFERNVHKTLILSFITLVVTGFALKFPETLWVKWLFGLGMTESIRAFVHRLAAVIMVADSLVFLVYLMFRRRGKNLFRDLLPGKRDLKDFIKTVRYYLGMSKSGHSPKYGMFSFAEKFEFWAMVWGTMVMLITGLILWFPDIVPGKWYSQIVPVARVIHYYEAILAALAILIWHGFHVIFHPDEYPMNTSWWSGYLTKKEGEHRFEDDAREKMKN